MDTSDSVPPASRADPLYHETPSIDPTWSVISSSSPSASSSSLSPPYATPPSMTPPGSNPPSAIYPPLPSPTQPPTPFYTPHLRPYSQELNLPRFPSPGPPQTPTPTTSRSSTWRSSAGDSQRMLSSTKNRSPTPLGLLSNVRRRTGVTIETAPSVVHHSGYVSHTDDEFGKSLPLHIFYPMGLPNVPR
jgi:hypothetical protein